MIHYNIYFKPYDWEVEVYVVLNNCYISKIIESLRDCPQSEIQSAFLNLTTRINSGFVKTMDKRSIVVINKPTTIEEFVNVYNHEKNHLEMHICEEFKIDPHSEEAAELSGLLAKQLFSSLIDELLIYYTNMHSKEI
jgi:hypothetical protein